MKKVLAFFLIFFLAMQFYRPDKNSSDIESHKDFLTVENVPADIARIFKTSCYDCHSNQTDYAWYDNIAPLSWYVDKNIKRAKFSLNFSKWGEFEPWQRRVFFQGGMMYDIDIDRMPPKSYLALHPKAKISQEQREVMKAWIATVDLMKE